MLIQHAPFDTSILQIPVSKIFLTQEEQKQDFLSLKEKLAKKSENLFFSYTPFYIPNIQFLEKIGFHLITIRQTYIQEIKTHCTKNNHPELNTSSKIIQQQHVQKIITQKKISKLAETIGKTSRYYKDPLIKKQKAQTLYEKWIYNSIFQNYAQEVFCTTEKEEITGIATIKRENNSPCAFIDLIGVLPQFQRKKIGTLLLESIYNYCKEKHIHYIKVITEGENIQANAFYQKNNFVVEELQLVYHKHI